jgi:RNA-directed DNA polymerase
VYHMRHVSLNALGYSVLGVPPEVLRGTAEISATLYRSRLSCRDGKSRIVDQPSEQLALIQRAIHRRVLKDVPVSAAGQSVKGHSTTSNAALHLGQACVIRFDILDFFRTVTEHQVCAVWHRLGFGRQLVKILTCLSTLRGHLPVGAPTSPALGNLVLASADREIENLCWKLGLTYSRWVDDLIVSGSRAREVIGPIAAIVRAAGFSLNRAKTKIMSGGRLKVVTGLTVNGDHVSVPRQFRDGVRAAIHKLASEPLSQDAAGRLARSIEGSIAYIEAHNQGNANRLKRQLRHVPRGEVLSFCPRRATSGVS